MVALGAIATAVTTLTPSSTLTELNENRFGQAYYAAYSGMDYARSLTDSGLSAINTATNSEQTYTLDNAKFTLVVGAKSGTTYPVRSIGISNTGTSLQNNYLLGPVSVTPVSSSLRPTSLATGVTGTAVYVAGTVTGSVSASNVTLHDGSTITGSLTSMSTSLLTITGGDYIGGNICSNDGVSISGGATVASGYVYSHGDVTVSGGATVGNDIYATGNVTIDGGSTINGNINSQKMVNFNSGNMGTKKVQRYIYAGNAVKLAGGNDLYIDVHSQSTIDLAGIYVHGDAYDKTGHGLTTSVSWSKLYGKEYSNPTAPTAPADCTYTKPSTISFTATTDGPTAHTSVTYSAGDYYLKSFSMGNWGQDKICFDTSGGNINIFVDGNVTSGAGIYVKTSAVNNCFTNALNSTTASYSSEASKVFIYSTGTFTLMDGANWFGTVLAVGDVQPGNGSDIIGSLHSINGTVNPSNKWYDINIVNLTD
jgi:cytoskeletal protein CcmA (bactofilin family)